MSSVMSLLNDVIPITEFNKGKAGKIFETVKREDRPKIVFKNNAPECVLLAPEYFQKLMDELDDLRLLALADARLTDYDPTQLISAEAINKRYGFDANDNGLEDVEIE